MFVIKSNLTYLYDIKYFKILYNIHDNLSKDTVFYHEPFKEDTHLFFNKLNYKFQNMLNV